MGGALSIAHSFMRRKDFRQAKSNVRNAKRRFIPCGRMDRLAAFEAGKYRCVIDLRDRSEWRKMENIWGTNKEMSVIAEV
jgi:hypothetical protein